MILQIAKDNHYTKVVIYLEQNVQKAQRAVDAFEVFSPSKMLLEFFEVVAPRSPKEPELPFTMNQTTVSSCRGITIESSEPHYV